MKKLVIGLLIVLMGGLAALRYAAVVHAQIPGARFALGAWEYPGPGLEVKTFKDTLTNRCYLVVIVTEWSGWPAAASAPEAVACQ